MGSEDVRAAILLAVEQPPAEFYFGMFLAAAQWDAGGCNPGG